MPTGPVGSPGTPRGCDLLITGGRVLDPTGGTAVLSEVDIAVLGGTIVDLGAADAVAARWTPERRLDASGQVVMPGFVDAHVHLSAFLGAGRPYVPTTAPGLFAGAGRVQDILPMMVRLMSQPVPAELIAAVAAPVLAAMLRAGFTSVVDAGSAGIEGLVGAATRVGIRAAIGPSLADSWHDAGGRLVRQDDPDRLLDIAHAAVAEHNGAAGGRVRVVVSAVETTACSDELLRGIADLTRTHDLPTHVHSHISPDSVRAHDAAFGRSATERLLDAGMLTGRCTLMHAATISDDDIECFARTGVTVNHNPIGNSMLGFGTTGSRAVPRLLEAGVPIVLGSDYAPSAIPTPFELVRAALMLHREVAASDDALTLEQALAMAVHSGPGVGRPGQVGRVAIGQLADLVLIDTTGLHHIGAAHAVPAVALRATAGDVTTVLVAGEPLVQGGRLTLLDEQELLRDADRALGVLQQ